MLKRESDPIFWEHSKKGPLGTLITDPQEFLGCTPPKESQPPLSFIRTTRKSLKYDIYLKVYHVTPYLKGNLMERTNFGLNNMFFVNS